MNQNPPNWLTLLGPLLGPFISALGVIFAYERWIVENRVQSQRDRLEMNLDMERKEKEFLKKELDSATQDVDAAYKTISDTLNDIQEKHLNPEHVIKLARILGKLKKYGSRQEEIDDYRVAAKELISCSSPLIKKAVEVAIKNHRSSTQKLSPWRRQHIKQNFEGDITNYVNWIYECLFISGHPDNNPLNSYVLKPTLTSVDPYLAAIKYIKNEGDWSNLSIHQVTYLYGMFDELLARLPSEFRSQR